MAESTKAGTRSSAISGKTVVEAIKNRPFKALGLTVLSASFAYNQYTARQKRVDDAKKKKVLVLPFYRMKIVEEKKSKFSLSSNPLLGSLLGGWGGMTTSHTSVGPGTGPGGSQTIEMPVDEVVTLIHEAAQDPGIVGLYGVFGKGGNVQAGWAHLEEIRNALQVFKTAHRQHHEPPSDDLPATAPPKTRDGNNNDKKRKFMYVYADTFATPRSSMKDFYVASAFSKIHMQENGDLNLFGLHSTSTFIKDFLMKYGISVNVWKHGEYKNAANTFTHNRYSRDHFENVAGILLPMHQYVCNSIYSSRYEYLKKYDAAMDDGADFWDMVTRAGSLPSQVAHQIGFIDFMARMDPLDILLKSNSKDINEKTKTVNEDKAVDSWKDETDFEQFSADSKISIAAYARKRKIERAKESKRAAETSGVMQSVSSLMGSAETSNSKEQIAVIKVNGAITEATARKVEKALRSVKGQKDVKCVVLRVDSPGGSINACETIYQRIQDLPQKVVVSFGNVSASGGYYISANADRIFASPTTITGSIGVFMLRVDIRGLANRYGITFDSIPTSPLSGSFDSTSPVNATMDDNFAISSDRAYHRFKSLVSEGRKMDMDSVEIVARGRVWTGVQAKEVGLVDELGGLQRAVAYAQREFTTAGNAQVVQWPPKKSLWQLLMSQDDDMDDDLDSVELPELGKAFLSQLFAHRYNWFGHMERAIVPGEAGLFGSLTNAVPVTSGVMLAADENAAIRIALEENGFDFPSSSSAGVGWDF
eukprot:CAMPEP_0113455936 /NCGR_PEP_ID=MMETSP0014_2-20120614/8629_1 /TAXON_ID=2857 /ORGANISM="Nitzschia sp." /LENGTH=760 /DNA_ID=CAMNT_0000347375 /DNA_START=139 /DNA_END=2421 /DNA_ORIENTATION=+ /assembly_acc=CAM_ASM_000159